MRKLGVGIYGRNGHQIHEALANHPVAELVAEDTELDILLADTRVELVSLCSPRRADQARDAVRCMESGKHVYAEKPCALVEADLDAILATSRATGCEFREMGGTYLQSPYREMREAIQAGAIGDVVQILAQKSYPWADWRPADDAVDGGLALQVGVYVTRFVEHVTGAQIASITLAQTDRAAAFTMRLQNGGMASAICNYLNPFGATRWGWEFLRVFGTAGVIESHPLQLIPTGKPPRSLPATATGEDYFTRYARSLRGGPPMPETLAWELEPTRWVIRARAKATLGRT